MKRRKYEKVIERCKDCPEFDFEFGPWDYVCKKRNIRVGCTACEIKKILMTWFATCDLPEVKDE